MINEQRMVIFTGIQTVQIGYTLELREDKINKWTTPCS